MFDKILGQEGATQYLKRICNSGNIHHAYLFLGEKGVGKKFAAKVFAAFLNCKQQNKPCGYCSSCVKILKGLHPDVKIVLPEGQSIKTEQIREIINEVYMKPYEGQKKVYIIDEAASMTVQAQNAFLKTLEEPPQDCVLILISNTTKGLLPTILSRLAILRFGLIDTEIIEKHLKESLGADESTSKLAARLSKGSIGRALDIITSRFLEFREEVIEIIYSLLIADSGEIFDYYSFFEKNKDRIEEILDLIFNWFRDFIVFAATGDELAVVNLDCLWRFNKLFERGVKPTLDYLEIIKKAKYSLFYNVNYQTAVFNMLLDLKEVKNKWLR